MSMENKEKEIKAVIEKIRPYLQRDGGDVEYVSFDLNSGVVYVRMHGACSDCLALDETLKLGIEAMLLEEVEGVNEVRVASE